MSRKIERLWLCTSALLAVEEKQIPTCKQLTMCRMQPKFSLTLRVLGNLLFSGHINLFQYFFRS